MNCFIFFDTCPRRSRVFAPAKTGESGRRNFVLTKTKLSVTTRGAAEAGSRKIASGDEYFIRDDKNIIRDRLLLTIIKLLLTPFSLLYYCGRYAMHPKLCLESRPQSFGLLVNQKSHAKLHWSLFGSRRRH